VTRVEQLNQVVDEFQQSHDRWLDNRNAGVAPDDPLCDAIERLQTVFDAGVCPVSHIDMNNAVMELQLEYGKWQNSRDDEPRPAFWEAVRRVFDCRKRIADAAKEPDQIAPIKRLREQGLSDKQIAYYVYGWQTRDGKTYDANGDKRCGPFVTASGGIEYTLMEQEQEKPGSVLKPNTELPYWVHPSEAARMVMSGRFDTAPAIQIGPVERTREEREAEAVKLITDGGTMAQVCRVCGLTESEVAALCNQHSLALPMAGFASLQPSQEDLDSAIRELLEQGKQDNEIVNTLRQRGMSGANKGRVAAVRQRPAVTASK
jgi:hypothetical protein